MTPALRQYSDPSQLLMYEDPPELAQYAARGDLPDFLDGESLPALRRYLGTP